MSVIFLLLTWQVTFTALGLPVGVEWFVATAGGPSYDSMTDTITFLEPNGTYPYVIGSANTSYAAAPGSFAVNGKAVVETPFFHLVIYPVSFSEVGLPLGTTWYVNLTGGASYSSATAIVSFSEPNGSYGYSVGFLQDHWLASPTTGTLSVSGAAIAEPVSFAYAYALVFDRPDGTPAGKGWAVSLSGATVLPLVVAPATTVTRSTNNSSLTFYEPNGTYRYWILVTGVAGYNSSGGVSVSGSNATVVPASILHGNSELDEYVLYGGLAAAVVVIVVIALTVLQRRKPPTAPVLSVVTRSDTPPSAGDDLTPPRGDAAPAPGQVPRTGA